MSQDTFNSRLRAVSAALTHVANYALVGAVVVAIATLLGLLPGVLNVLAIVVAGFWGLTNVASILHEHDTTLCIPCMEAVPADAPARAQRRKIVLRFHHFRSRRTVVMVALPLLFGGPAVLILALRVQPSDVALLAYVPAFAWGFASVFAASQHRQLRPWCSYCRGWDKGGDHEPSPDPVAFDTLTLR